jgi:transposase
MSFHGMTTNDLMKMFDVGRLTIYHWFNAWETRRLAGLYDHKGRGRHPKLTPEEQEKVYQYIEQYPKDIKKVVYLLKQETSKCVSTKTINRLLKKTPMLGSASRNLQRNSQIRSSMSGVKP